MTDLILTSPDNIQRILDEYAAWAEEQELDHRDSSVDAYKAHLRAQRPLQALQQIADITRGWPDDRLESIYDIATEALKEAAE